MNIQHVALYILQALAIAQTEGRTMSLEDLVEELKIRRKDVRSALSSLHQEGYLDVLRMRLTMAGFATGRRLLRQELPALRVPAAPHAAVA